MKNFAGMNRIIKAFSFATGLAVLFSCNDGLETASLIINQESIEVSSEGGQTTIGVKSNRDWSANVDVDWISLTPSSAEAFEASSYMIVTAQPNIDLPREAHIVVSSKSGEVSAVVTVLQGENRLILKNASQMIAAFEDLANSEKQEDYILGRDIDMEGKTLPSVARLNAVFDGQGHSISNLKVTGSLFEEIGASGCVRNLVLAADCSLTIPGDIEKTGIIAGTSAGTIENVTNNADITVSGVSKGYKGSICGESTGPVTSCVNRGDIFFDGAPHSDGSMYFGGVIGRASSADVEVRNCSNEGDMKFVFNDELTQSVYIAGVSGAINNNAKILNCTNSGNVLATCKGSNSNALIAGVVCYAGGEVSDCSNSGDVEFRSESAYGLSDGPVKGTGIAGIASYVGWTDNTVKNNTNSGNIALSAGYTLGYQTVGGFTKYSSNVGGVFACAYKCSVEGCSNSGSVSSRITRIELSPAPGFNTTARQSVGGIISSAWGIVSCCTNYGKIDVDWRTSSHDAPLAKNFVTMVGGIVGGDYHSDQLSTYVKDCINEGDIEIICDAAGSNNAFGGISGWPTKENASGKSVTNCVNKGNITVDGFSKSRIGGITGGAASHIGNTNYGKVYLKHGASNCAIGGVAGFMNFLNISDCSNYGDVVTDVVLNGSQSSAAGAAGALVGAVGNTDMTYSNCRIDCSLSAPGGSTYSMLVGAIGHAKSGGKPFAVGTADAPVLVKGKCCSTELTEDNYSGFLTASNYSNLNAQVTFNVGYLK